MKRCRVMACLTVLVACLAISECFAATVDFETVGVGTAYGSDYGNLPGEVVLTQDGIDMSVEEFLLGTFVGLIKAEVGGRYSSFFTSTPLELDNISVEFDFTNVGFDVTRVTLEYQEFGGSNNFAVNGEAPLVITPLSNLPIDVAPGVTAAVADGVITLLGNVDSVRIGGQELGIDTIVAVPEPASIILLGLGFVILLRRRRNARTAKSPIS